jgi:hypothetical protein
MNIMLCDKLTEMTVQYYGYHGISVTWRLQILITVNTMLCDKLTEMTVQYHGYHGISVTWRLQILITTNTMLCDKLTEVTVQYIPWIPWYISDIEVIAQYHE